MVGTNFIESSLKDVQFDNCDCRYVNFADSKINNLIIKSSNFNEASFNETKIKNIELNKVKFNKAEFFNTCLENVDFSSCDISEIRIDKESIKGIIIDRFQAECIVQMFGVKIKF